MVAHLAATETVLSSGAAVTTPVVMISLNCMATVRYTRECGVTEH